MSFSNWQLEIFSHFFDNSSIGTISDSKLYGGVNYECNINPNEDLIVGTTASAKITFITDGLNWNSVGETFTYSIKQANDTGFRQIGKFIITDSDKNENGRYEVTAYDNLILFEKDVKEWNDDLPWNTNITVLEYLNGRANVFHGLFYEVGLTSYTINSFTNSDIVMPNINPFGGNQINARTILGYIASVAGGFIISDSSGNIVVKHFSNNLTTAKTIDNTQYKSFYYADYYPPDIEVVKVSMGENDIGISYPEGVSGSTLNIPYNAIFYNNSIASMTAKVGNIYDIVSEYHYKPVTLELYEDFGINVGDTVLINNSWKTYIFSKSFSSKGVSLRSTGNVARELTDAGDDQIQQMVGKFHTIENDVNQHRQVLGDLLTGDSIEFKIDSNGVYVTNEEGLTTTFDGSKITANTINADDILVNGTITWDKVNTTSFGPHITSDIFRQDTVPTTDVQGAFWYVTAIPSGIQLYNTTTRYSINDMCYRIDGGTVYYICKASTIGAFDETKWEQLNEDNWYTWDGTCWNLSTSPYYIKSTYIDGAKLVSPTIYGNEIKVLNGQFEVKDAQDAQLYGYMGLGQETDASGNINNGIILSASDDTTLGTQDAYTLLTTNGIRLSFNDYSLIIRNNGVFYRKETDQGTVEIELGLARFS